MVVVSCLDIAFSVNVLVRYMVGSVKCYWNGVFYVLRYLRGIINFGLIFSGFNGGCEVLEVFMDVDFVNGVCLKSVLGVVVRMYGNCVFWCLKR